MDFQSNWFNLKYSKYLWAKQNNGVKELLKWYRLSNSKEEM